jgi:DNA-binding transcriptional ArsR family regulator
VPTPPEDRWPLVPDAQRDLLMNSAALRASAHPVRIRILGVLRLDGPSTATALAARLGLNSGATSYHLRQLAGGGLIVEDVERGTGRERWWRAAHRSIFFKPGELGEDDDVAGVAYLRALALVFAERMQQAADERPQQPPQWQDATAFNDYPLLLTADEAGALVREIEGVVSRYRHVESGRAQAPAGVEPFHVQLQAFVRPGWEVGSE